MGPEPDGPPTGDEPVVVATTRPEETERLGAELVRDLGPGDVVLVSGDLGAGKTTFVRGAVRELGHTGRVTSPTFTIVNRYEEGRIPVSHLDLYRLGETGLDAEDPSLLADELGGDRIVFIEWPEAAAHEPLGHVALRVVLRHAGADEREIEIERVGEG
ncbi:MAG TPA: tRNA (adenosine(37)-N6)-threonylcarbamoyltransferase complex ATPase subunit type 1 TsaE [Capillimicrobium sp.]|nr:tRNA (adenosine(37)-N6)-threonylcarbamoyltransferase complex ATPase subunit type 1 TsaE [Capillimicrobium sp.]